MLQLSGRPHALMPLNVLSLAPCCYSKNEIQNANDVREIVTQGISKIISHLDE